MSENGDSLSDHSYENLPPKNDQLTAGTSSEGRSLPEHFKATRLKFQQMATVDMDVGPKPKTMSAKHVRKTKLNMQPDVRPKENKTDTKQCPSIPNQSSTDVSRKNGQGIRKPHEVCADDVMPFESRVKPPIPGPRHRSIDTCTISSEGASGGYPIDSVSMRVSSGSNIEQAVAQASSYTKTNTNMKERLCFGQDSANEIPYGGSDFVQVTGSHKKHILCQPNQTSDQEEKRNDLQGKRSAFQDLHIHVHFYNDDGKNHDQNGTIGDKFEDDDSASQSSTRRMRQSAVPSRGRHPIHIHIHGDSMDIVKQKQTPKQRYETVDIDSDSEDTEKEYSPLNDESVFNEINVISSSPPEPAPTVPPRKPITSNAPSCLDKAYEKPDDWRYDDGKSTTKSQQSSFVPERKARTGTPSWILPYKDYDLPDAKVLEIFNSDQSLKNQVMELYGNPWFYLYPDVNDAHKYLSLRNEDGCFALVAENIEGSPFQPFTITVIKEKRHIRVPILKTTSDDSHSPSKLMLFDKSYDTIVELLDDLICNSNKELGFKLRKPNDASKYQTNTSS
ncbi:uncharacterized protein LOC127839321 isoform X1 [Dreissena polymorpha]|uniref:uncharacterized protein LOC127839321 isoform X1 n=1 Tax=Dreissena polymorpha TaxID=45954 RepID=UPI0022646496|nr:uncharacterized protein LOC127839321 isoform X1 [Dreissena polymorpha]